MKVTNILSRYFLSFIPFHKSSMETELDFSVAGIMLWIDENFVSYNPTPPILVKKMMD